MPGTRWLHTTVLVSLTLAALAASLVLNSSPAAAAPESGPMTEAGVGNDYCLGCHAKPGQIKTLPNGEQLYLTIDPEGFAQSVHGAGGYACVQCHTTIREYPHPEFKAQTLRAAQLQLYPTCQQCHGGNYEKALDSVHAKALEDGNQNAAVCTDCHNPHYQPRLTNPATGTILPRAHLEIPRTCARCHSAIYDQYKSSVHGSALLQAGNPDVPTCIDCHGVHNIEDPRTSGFRLDSPLLCAKCHTDEARMSKYGISTAVLNTYVADFHGTTVTLFEKTSPDRETNKPVCFDCHGIHNIKATNDPEKGLQVRENMLAACQRCHPDAGASFSASWLSHYIPSPDKNSLVYYVNLFYKYFIPGVLGPMAIFVLSDLGRRVYQRVSRRARH